MRNRKKKATRHTTAFAWLRDNPRSPTKPAGGQRPRPKKGTKGPKRIVKKARLNARKHTDAERNDIMAARRKLEKATKKAKGRGKAASKPKRKAAKAGKRARLNPVKGGTLSKKQIKAMQDGRKRARAIKAVKASKKGGKGKGKARKSGGKAMPKTEAGLRTTVKNLAARVDNVAADMSDGLKRLNTKIDHVESSAESRFKRLTRVLEREDVISAEDRRLADKMG